MSIAGSFGQPKQLRVTFTLTQPNASFPGTGNNQLQLSSLRTIALIDSYVGFAAQLDLRVYGMKQADMNALSVIQFKPWPTATLNNVVTVEAYSGNGWTQIFSGSMIEASPEYREMPDVYLHVQAQAGYQQGIAVGTPLTYPAGSSVASAVQAVAAAMGFSVQNNGVTATIPKGKYYPGSPITQLQSICAQANVDFYFDPNNTIVICPHGQPRLNTPLINLAPTSGLISYPVIQAFGVVLTALFDPSLILAGKLQVSDTDVPAANGVWMPYSGQHQLESLRFGGMWMSTLQCTPLPT